MARQMMSLEGARHAAQLLLDASQYVAVTPLPFDNAWVDVRDDNAHVVEAAANDYPPNPEADDAA
jgi:hypothetical protein